MPSRVKPRISSRTVYTGLPISVSSAIRHFPESGILPQIMQARATTGIYSSQPNFSRQGIERAMDLAFVQAVAILIHKEVRLSVGAKAAVPAFRIIGQNLTGGGVQWYQTGFAKLGPPNGEDSFGPVQILRSEVQHLTEPEARDRQQSEDAVVGPGPQRVTGRPSFRGLQQPQDLLGGIEVRPSAGRSVW